MQIHVFVLHLVRATARRDTAQALLTTCKDVAGLSGELWPAVDGAGLSSDALDEMVGAKLFEPTYPFALKAGEIGCFLSYRQIWAEILRRDLGCALVFEDDVSLDTRMFARALELGKQHVDTLGYVQFQNRPAKGPAHLVDRADDASLTVPQITPVRASAQLINKKAAATLLGNSEQFDRPVDTFVQSHWVTGFRPGVIYPSGISTISDQLDGSTIQKSTKPLGEKLQREAARFFYRRALARYARQSTAPATPDIQ